MDTTQLKKFAQESRKQLMEAVSSKLDFVLAEDSLARRESRSAVIALEGLIKEIGKEQVIEKVAYTWFNRFCALRFMDVNRYSKIGVVSPAEGQTQPEILAEAKMGYIDNSAVSDAKTLNKIRELLNGTMTSKDPQGEAYRLLLVSYCNSFNALMPFMFERINDYTELLMPDDLLSTSSVLTKTVEILDADTCKDVEVIGWLYQYFNQDEKDRVIQAKKRYKAFEIPYATQLFTPKWIVRYMTQNSLGRLWMEAHPESKLKDSMEFYLEPRSLTEEDKKELEANILKDIRPEEIKVFDPACGSGHILVTAFQLLFEIYKSQGWQDNEIPELILKNNLYGLDICDRATQLAQFAVMMKAREYDRNIFNKVKTLNICSIKDTNWIDGFIINDLVATATDKEQARKQLEILRDTFKDAKIYGSLIKPNDVKIDVLEKIYEEYCKDGQLGLNAPKIKGRLPWIIKQAKIMKTQYECVITNPPYMGNKYMETKLAEFIQKEYKDVKSDLFSAFMVYCKDRTVRNGHLGFMTPMVWMFITSYEYLREMLINNTDISSLVQLEYSGFEGATVPICTFTLSNRHTNLVGSYVRLTEFPGAKNQPIKTLEAVKNRNCGFYYEVNNKSFHSIPGSPIAYWAGDRVREIFKTEKSVGNYAQPRQGMATSDNNRFLRFWHETDKNKIGFGCKSKEEAQNSNKKWFPYNKGGEFRKWYGNNDYLINYENNGSEVLGYAAELYGSPTRTIKNIDFYFRESVTWSFISSSCFGVRYSYPGAIFDVGGSSAFISHENIYYLTAFLCSKLAFEFLKFLNPTLNFQSGNIATLPYIQTKDIAQKEKINSIVLSNIEISKDDWDSFETSWDFEQHPLIRFKTNNNLKESFNAWKEYKEQQFKQLKANEEELNRLFIEIYGLQDEMDKYVADKDITVSLADELRDIKSLLSYAVGCMFGRYSLDVKGLAFAGGEFDKSKYRTLEADDDAVIPVLAEHMFSDDITSRFKDFLKAAFGTENFEENLEYVACVLGKKNTETADDTIRNYFMKDFYKDHIQTYQKRPIYWMFSSGKGNFNALVYMHRYNKDTASVILNSYLRNYRDEKLSAKISQCKLVETSASSSQADKIKASKERETMEKIVSEVNDYERDILYPLATERKEIDLDDGVKVNYLKFGKALKDFGLKAK